MRCIQHLFLGFASVLLIDANARADFDITNWILVSAVFDSEGSDLQLSSTVVNPFHETVLAQFDDSFVSTNYDVSWVLDYAMIDMVSNQHAEGLSGRIGAGGNLTFVPMTDSILSLSAQYEYAWHPSVFARASLSISVVELNIEEIFHDGRTGGNTPLGNPFGTLSLPDASVNLFAGRVYKIIFSTSVDYVGTGPPGQPGINTANISFSIAPVPEPSTVALLGLIAPAILFARRKRR